MGNTNYQTTVTRIVDGFSNPVDAEVIGNRLYVLENGGSQGLWEITFPPSSPNIILSELTLLPNDAFTFTVTATPGLSYDIQTSSDLVNWVVATNVLPSGNQFQFTDPAVIATPGKFYRVVQH